MYIDCRECQSNKIALQKEANKQAKREQKGLPVSLTEINRLKHKLKVCLHPQGGVPGRD